MQLESGSGSPGGAWRLLKGLLACALLALVSLLLVIYAHVLTGDSGLMTAAAVLGGALFLLTVAALATGILYAWRAYPQHHRPIVFVVAITLVTLIAHAYIIGSPPATDSATPVTGAVGAQLVSSNTGGNGKPLVTIASSAVGPNLTVTVTASSSQAIADLNLTQPTGLTGPGFSPAPTLSSPLQPGNSVTGTWQTSGNSSTVTLSYTPLDCYSTTNKEYGCIMDEIYYVPEAMAIFNGQTCSAGVGAPSDCHLEHPYLVPALMAAGMAVFGEFNVVGWRIAQALLGSFSIPILFGIAWKLSGNKRIAYVSAILFAVDIMFFAQSSAGLLDVPEIFFGLAAFLAYFAEVKVWKLDKYVMAGILLGLAGLAKETAVFMAMALLTYILLFDSQKLRRKTLQAVKLVAVLAIVFIVGLQAYDSVLMTPSQPGTTSCPITGTTFLNHIDYILCLGSSLTAKTLSCVTSGYWCRFPNSATPIVPLDWITFYSPVAYYRTVVSVCPKSVNGTCLGGSYSFVGLAYYGVTNFLETWSIYVWIPLVAYALYRWYWPKKQPGPKAPASNPEAPATSPEPQAPSPEPVSAVPISGDLKLATFALVLFFWTYVPYLFLFLASRVTYPFYFLPAVPAVAIGAAYWTTRDWFPRWLLYLYVGMAFVFFFIYFPYKGFLPDWLRVLIGH